ncbi:MAG: MFS transporter, partial [Terriglobia bacterium]
IETTAKPFLLAAAVSVVIGLFCFTLPAPPPPKTAAAVKLKSALGLDALVMLKDRSYLVFAIGSVLACIPLTFYFSFTNAFLNDEGVRNAAGKMTLGQASEVGAMLLMPFIFRRVTVKQILVVGLAAWSARYLLLAFGNAGTGMWMFYAAILLHGICYDFFFMTGQLYTDQQAPAHLRNSAQGLITFLTYGVGMFIGSLLSGGALDVFTTTVNGVVRRDWFGFWSVSSAGAFVLVLMVVAFFRTDSRIEAN